MRPCDLLCCALGLPGVATYRFPAVYMLVLRALAWCVVACAVHASKDPCPPPPQSTKAGFPPPTAIPSPPPLTVPGSSPPLAETGLGPAAPTSPGLLPHPVDPPSPVEATPPPSPKLVPPPLQVSIVRTRHILRPLRFGLSSRIYQTTSGPPDSPGPQSAPPHGVPTQSSSPPVVRK